MLGVNMVADTSHQAYIDILPELGERQLQVYAALFSLKVANNKMLSEHLNIPLSSVCGRMNELRNKAKLVTFSHKDICPYTKKNTNFYTLIKFEGGK